MVLIHPFPVPSVGIRLVNTEVEALVNSNSHGKGTLYVTEAIISWINSVSGEGFTIPYKKMSLHAISRDPAVHASHCLYIMVNGVLDDEENVEEAVPSDDDEEETTEIRFVPDDSSVLDNIYKAVQDCTLLHPDDTSDMSGLSGDDESHDDDSDAGFIAGDYDDIGMPGEGDEEYDDDDDEDEHGQVNRLQAFLRRQLRLVPGPGNRGRRNGSGDGNHENGNPPPYNPDQFADADE